MCRTLLNSFHVLITVVTVGVVGVAVLVRGVAVTVGTEPPVGVAVS